MSEFADEPDLRSTEEVETDEQREAFLRRLQEQSDLCRISATMEGRRFLWRIVDQTKAREQGFVLGDRDGSAFNAGLREVGLWVLSEIRELDRPNYLLMLQENDHG